MRPAIFSSAGLMTVISCNANGTRAGQLQFRIAMDKVDGLACSAVAEVLSQRGPVVVSICVLQIHALPDGRQVSTAPWAHQFICAPAPLQKYLSGRRLPSLSLYEQVASPHLQQLIRDGGKLF